MPVDVRMQLRDADVQAALARLVGSLPAFGDMSPAMQSMARVLKTGAQMRFRSGKAPDGTAWQKSRRAAEEGGQTLSLTRRLRNSITSNYSRTNAEVGTNVLYAAIHQFGGVIRAKKGPFLSIPVTPQARELGSPTRWPAGALKVWQTEKGQFVMGDDKGTVHYLLRRQVNMPARPFLGVSAADSNELVRVLQEHLQGQWKR